MVDKEVTVQVRTAVREGDLNRVSALLGDDRERLNLITPFGPLLHVAALFGKLDVVKLLLEKGVDINAHGGTAGGGALECAASNGHEEIVRYLIERGADLDVSDPQRNPLFSAIVGGHVRVAELLIRSGIDTSVRYSGESMENMDALAFAVERGQAEIEEMLLALGHRRQSSSGRH